MDARRESREANVDSVQVPLRGTLKVALLFIRSASVHFTSTLLNPVGCAVFKTCGGEPGVTWPPLLWSIRAR